MNGMEHEEARMRKRMPMVTWFLDSPQITQPAANPDRFEVSGWIAGYGAIESIRFADEESARLLPVSRVDRPDVTATYGIPAAGFSASCRYADIAHRPYVTLLFTHQGRDNEIVIPVRRPATDLATLKAEKLRRIRGILQCPVCAAHDFDERDGALHCGGCASAFPRSPAHRRHHPRLRGGPPRPVLRERGEPGDRPVRDHRRAGRR